MSLTGDASNVNGRQGTSEHGSDSFNSSNSAGVEHPTGSLSIRTRVAGMQIAASDGLPGAGSTSSSGFLHRRLHRDSLGGSYDFRRDHRSYSTDWISSPLLEGFASFHSALNGVQEAAPSALATTTSTSHDVFTSALPYPGTSWANDHSGESSVDSTRSTQENSSMTSNDGGTTTDSLVLDEWDLIKPRTFSIDVSSPVPMENLMPFMFPMDPTEVPGAHLAHLAHQNASSAHSADFLAVHTHTPHQSMDATPMAPYTTPSMFVHPPDHLPRTSYSHWQQHHQHPMLMEPDRAVLTTSSSPNGSFPRVAPINTGETNQLQFEHHATLPPQSLATRYPSASSPSSSVPLADTQLLTKLNSCYWKNGRKNLQCFPICPEHNDFYSMKMSNRKHTSVGVCRGPVYTHVFLPASPSDAKPPVSSSMGQHMKYEYGVGASGSGGSAYEVFVLGKFERVPQRNENDDLETLLPPPEHFATAAAFEGFRYSCFQAVEMEERRVTTATRPTDHHAKALPDHIVRSTWFFLPDVWKVQPMLKKKRKATRSSPAQAFPFCFRVFVYIRESVDAASSSPPCGSGAELDAGNAGAYRCLATTASSFFELYSTRTVDRVKRKYWGQEDGEEGVTTASTPSSSHVAKRVSRG